MKASGVVMINVKDYEEYKKAMLEVGVSSIEDLPEFLTHKVRAVRVYAGRRMDELRRDTLHPNSRSV